MANGGDILQLCRLCLVKDDVNIPIFEEQGDIRQIFLKISSCLPVKVAREDKLPKKICDGCSYKLDMLYEFWNTTANAEKQLLSWLGEAGVNAKLADGTISAVAQQIKPVETFVKQEAIDPSDIHTEDNDDDKSYMFQQKFAVEEAGPSATVTLNEDEPPPKRARRTAAVKAQIAMDPESDDDDDSGEPLTKVEDESEDSEGDDHEPPFVDVPSTSADDQPGPSGVGKDGEAPSSDILGVKKIEYACNICVEAFDTQNKLEDHLENIPVYYYCKKCDRFYDYAHTCKVRCFRCGFCNKVLKLRDDMKKHRCFHIYTRKDFVVEMTNCNLCAEAILADDVDLHLKTCKEANKPRPLDTVPYRLCHVCGKKVRSDTISNHLGRHSENLSYKCGQCEKAFNVRTKLRKHMLVHSDELRYQCSVCDKKVKSRFSLIVHLRTHAAVKPFECLVCQKTFTTKQWRNSHMAVHKTSQSEHKKIRRKKFKRTKRQRKNTNASNIYFCTSCKDHFNTHHDCTVDDGNKSSEIYCKICKLLIPKTEVAFHRSMCEYDKNEIVSYPIPLFNAEIDVGLEETKDKAFRCKPCQLKFETRSDYRRHRYRNHDDKFRICFMCGKAVMNLNQHVKSVHGDREAFKCTQCDKTFSCTKHLNRHKLVHSNEFKYQCQKCGKGFKTPFSLRVHLRSHDAVKPFECAVCLKTFTTKQWRDNHRRTHVLV